MLRDFEQAAETHGMACKSIRHSPSRMGKEIRHDLASMKLSSNALFRDTILCAAVQSTKKFVQMLVYVFFEYVAVSFEGERRLVDACSKYLSGF